MCYKQEEKHEENFSSSGHAFHNDWLVGNAGNSLCTAFITCFFQSLRIRQYCWETPFCLGVITVIHAGMGMSEAQQECEMCCLLNLIMH